MRTRTVHPADMVAHLWAHKSQDFARNPGHNFYFHGDTIYSYGSHFPVARHVENKRGRAVLFTTRSYSSTTAGHKCMVEGACRHLTVFHVADVNEHGTPQAVCRVPRGIHGPCRQVCQSAATQAGTLGRAARFSGRGKPYAAFFGLRPRLTLPDDLTGHDCRVSSNREEGPGTEATGRAQAGTGSARALAEVG